MSQPVEDKAATPDHPARFVLGEVQHVIDKLTGLRGDLHGLRSELWGSDFSLDNSDATTRQVVAQTIRCLQVESDHLASLARSLLPVDTSE